jgi:hypothetical protein
MMNYELGVVTASDPVTGMCDVTMRDSAPSLRALGVELPQVGWTVWVHKRGELAQDWVIVDIQTPAVRVAPGQVVPGGLSSGANTVTATSGTEVVGSGAGLTLLGVPLLSGRYYRVEITGRIQCSAANGTPIVRVRASTGTVTTASTAVLDGQKNLPGAGPTGAADISVSRPWAPASSGTWNLAVTIQQGIVHVSNESWGPGQLDATITIYGA